jgi:hypothetical protein
VAVNSDFPGQEIVGIFQEIGYAQQLLSVALFT